MRTLTTLLLTLALVAAGCQMSGSRDRLRLEQAPTSSLPAPAQSGVIPITPANARIEFTGATALSSQAGHFAAFEGSLEMPTDDPKDARIRVVVDMDSTTTSIGLLTKHLKNEDFFDVPKFPKAEFVSEKVVPLGEPGQYRVAGRLTFHGTSKPVEFPARITVSADEVMIDGTLTIRQTEFGMAEGAKKAKDEVPVRVTVRGRPK